MRKKIFLTSIYFIAGLIAFGYIFLRALNLGITYDEAWTINGFVPQRIIDILYCTSCDANNHIINTLLIKLFFYFGNHSLFIARLPNVLIFCIYAFYGYKITYKYLSPLIGVCCFLLLLLNPFLLDFFSIARGYGLSLGFLMISLWFTLEYVRNYKASNVFGSMGLGAVAVLCGFSLLNYYLALILIINAVAMQKGSNYNFKKTFLYSIGISIALVAIIFQPIRKLKENGSLYYGGNTGFYSDTLGSLAKYSLYNAESNSLVHYSLNIFLIVIILSILISFFFNRAIITFKNTILSITMFCILSVIIQHLLFGTLYLIDRTALFFYPLFIFILCFSLNEFSHKIVSKIIILIVIAFGVNFINHANLYKTVTWYFDAHSKEILTMINEKGKKLNKKIKIDYSWPFKSSIGYYVQQNNYPFIEIVKNINDREDINLNADYYIYLSKSLEKVGYDANNQKILSVPKDTTQQFINENIIIFANKRK